MSILVKKSYPCLLYNPTYKVQYIFELTLLHSLFSLHAFQSNGHYNKTRHLDYKTVSKIVSQGFSYHYVPYKAVHIENCPFPRERGGRILSDFHHSILLICMKSTLMKFGNDIFTAFIMSRGMLKCFFFFNV